jgi:hypothetical protein
MRLWQRRVDVQLDVAGSAADVTALLGPAPAALDAGTVNASDQLPDGGQPSVVRASQETVRPSGFLAES